MTKQHPLTDDIIESELATPSHFTSGSLVGLFTHDDVRSAADWQLEQVIEWLNNNLYYIQEDGSIRYHNCVNPVSGKYVVFDHYQIIDDLRKAMRPQEDD